MFLAAFPKTDLHGGHIGDGYPVCSDLPDDLHLRKGATYVYRGYEPVCNKDSVLTGGQGLGGCADNTAAFPRGYYVGQYGPITLSDASALGQALCSADAAGACTFPSVVTLTDNLPCDGDECDVQFLKQVKISSVSTTSRGISQYTLITLLTQIMYLPAKVEAQASEQKSKVVGGICRPWVYLQPLETTTNLY